MGSIVIIQLPEHHLPSSTALNLTPVDLASIVVLISWYQRVVGSLLVVVVKGQVDLSRF